MPLKKQIIWNTTGNTVYFASLWLLTVITTRILGYETVGILTLAMAVGNVVGTIQMFGMRAYQSSDISFQFTEIDYYITRILTVLSGWLIGIAACLLLGYEKQVCLSVMLFILVKSSETFSDVLFGNVQRLGHLEYAGYSMLLRGVLLTLLFTMGAVMWKSLNAALLTAAAGVLALSLLVDIPVHNRLMHKQRRIKENVIVEILKTCFPILIATLIPAIIAAFPRVVLERYCGAETLGYYGNVSTPALLLTTVIPTILIALLPGYGKATNQKNFWLIREIWLKSLAGVTVFTVICMIGVLLFGKEALALVYTEEIKAYVHFLYPVLIAMMLYTFTMCNNTVLVALRKNWGLTLITMLALFLNLLLSVPLVRVWGIHGAIAALAVPYAVQAVVQTVWIILICKKSEE